MSRTIGEIPKKLQELLQAVKCPLLGKREESWLQELLFSSSVNHNEFLKWVLYSFDEELVKTEKAEFSSLSLEEQQEHLHHICCSIGLCTTSDMDLVKGTGKKESLVEFWEFLLNIHLTHVGTPAGNIPFDFQLSRNISGISKLDISNDSDDNGNVTVDISSQPLEWKIFPPALAHELQEYAKTSSLKPVTKETVTNILCSLKENCQEPESEVSKVMDLESLHERVMINIDCLNKTLSGFEECHKQLQSWLRKKVATPETSRLEDLVKTAAQKMDVLQKMLDDMALEFKMNDLNENFTQGHSLPPVADSNEDVIKMLKRALDSKQKT